MTMADSCNAGWTGTWAWYPAEREMFWSRTVYRILGLDPRKTTPSLGHLFRAIHRSERRHIQLAFRGAVRRRQDFEQLYAIVGADGRTRHIHCAASPVLVDSGTLSEYVGYISDITARRAAEESARRAQSELVRVSRVFTMGALTASIAHEVNQPLAAVITNGNAGLRWLKSATPRLDRARKSLAAIVRDAERASEIIARIRRLAGHSGALPERKPLDVCSLIREVIALIRSELRESGAVLRLRLSDGLPSVLGDFVQLQQGILNLVVNGIEAMRSSGTRAGELTIVARRDRDRGICVTVRDSGIGIGARRPEQLFEPFYTTKHGGMGLGLALSGTIVEMHGGRIWVTKNPRRGATFHFTLPLAREGRS
jgi:signal transduction histidine kinase